MEISDAVLASALIKAKNYDIYSLPDDIEINHIFSDNFENKMNKLILSFEKKDKHITLFKNVLIKAAVILLTISAGIFSVIMINPQARADFKNAVTEFYENHIKFYFISEEQSETDFSDYKSVYAAYIPKGFSLKEKYTEYESVGYKYQNEENHLTFDIYVSLNDGLSVQTDKKNFEKLSLSGKDSYLITGENDNNPYSTLIIPGNSITVTVYGQINREEIIKIGNSLTEE